MQKIYLALGIFVAILIVLILILVCFPVAEIQSVSEEFQSLQRQILEIEQKNRLFEELKSDFSAIEPKISEVEKFFLTEEEIPTFILTLENIAASSGNVFKIEVIPSLSIEGGHPSLDFRVRLWGNFSQLLRFLASLENVPFPPYRLVEVRNLSIYRLGEKEVSKEAGFEGIRAGDLVSTIDIKIYTH